MTSVIRRDQMLNRALLSCGIVSSLLYIAMNIFIAMLYDGYSSASQTVSELSAVDAPTRQLWVVPGYIYTLLVAAFGWGIAGSATANRALRICGYLLTAYGIIGIGWAFFPMHKREVIAAGGANFSDTMHIVYSFVSLLFMLAAIVFGAAGLGKRFRIYSIATLLVFLVFGILTFLEAPELSAGMPTPYIGVWERNNIGAFMLWMIVLAIIMMRRERLYAMLSYD